MNVYTHINTRINVYTYGEEGLERERLSYTDTRTYSSHARADAHIIQTHTHRKFLAVNSGMRERERERERKRERDSIYRDHIHAERVHVVLSREGGLTSLGLASQETVTQVSPEPRC